MMNSFTIFAPMFAQVALSAAVWFYMYKTRIAHMKENRIHPQELANKTRARELLQEVSGPSDNFINLFEIPVLFYVLSFLIYLTGNADEIFLVFLIVFVALRYFHSYIQITRKKIMTRFKVYFASTIVLWAAWALLAYRLYS
jgi:hypothetical protein